MALSREFVQAHVRDWSERLKSPYFPHRQHWPKWLFHHAPLENAVRILQDGHLRSRRDLGNTLDRDVAGRGVIENRDDAKPFVRLYFRPKTPTQYHIEGIRREDECQYGPLAHAPVLIMFVLNAEAVLTRPDIKFSPRNMQGGGAPIQETEAEFRAIPFEKVYHEGSTLNDQSIIAHRCAEVLTSSPLPLGEVLNGIWLRSVAERETLLHLLGDASNVWAPLCHVSDALKVFEKKHTFFESVTAHSDGLSFVINDRADNGRVDIALEATHTDTGAVTGFHSSAHRTRHETGNRFIFRRSMPDGLYLVEGRLEGQLAYKAWQMIGNPLF